MTTRNELAEIRKKNRLIFNAPTYDTLNNLVKIVLPGLGALYFAIAAIWGLPYAEEVVGTLAAIAVFGGTLLTLSKRSYDKELSARKANLPYDGALVLNDSNPDNDSYRIQIDSDLPELMKQDVVVLKVKDLSQ